MFLFNFSSFFALLPPAQTITFARGIRAAAKRAFPHWESDVHNEFDRRSVLSGGLVGLGVFLYGCKSAGPVADSSTPGPLWPQYDTKPATAPAPTPVAPPQPTPGDLTPPPGVTPRAAWNPAKPILSRANPMNGISRITIHHSAVPSANVRAQNDVATMLRNIQYEHMHRKGEPFADIGYHYVIDPTGRIWEGRALSLQGAHVANNNEHNLGIMVMGNFEIEQPSRAAITTLDSFTASQMHKYNIPVSRVYTHRELGKTACPGANLQRYMLASRAVGGMLRNA